jgi:hypothetical protein
MGASTVFDPESKSEGQIRALLNRFNARKHQRHSDFGLGFTSDFGLRILAAPTSANHPPAH